MTQQRTLTGALPRSRALTARQVRELLAGSPVPDPEVSALVMMDAYELGQGDAVLVVFGDGKGRRYESRAALLAMLDALADQPHGPALADLLPQGRQFAEQAGRLAAELGVAALPELDAVVKRLGAPACLSHPAFGRLVAYVGETIRATVGGGWQMRLAADGRTWEPWLVDAEGRQHAPFGLVMKELIEWGPESSLAGVVSGHLTRLNRKPAR
jgi:hypothetical protein